MKLLHFFFFEQTNDVALETKLLVRMRESSLLLHFLWVHDSLIDTTNAVPDTPGYTFVSVNKMRSIDLI